ncbi:MAG: MBL fold metallo-hydrolase [Candidatus Bathyarchaeia archaeon]
MRAYVLGTSAATTAPRRDNASLLLEAGGLYLLIDCPGSVAHKMARLSLNPLKIWAIFITHAHPEHIYGLPALVHLLGRKGRREALPIYLPLGEEWRAARLLEAFSLFNKPGRFRIELRGLPGDGEPFIREGGFRASCLRVDHKVAANGIRVEAERPGRIFAYTGDTRPCQNAVALGRRADIFFHDSTYPDDRAEEAHSQGHSTAGDAGDDAERAGARRLALFHIGSACFGREGLIRRQAAARFGGEVILPKDLSEIDI